MICLTVSYNLKTVYVVLQLSDLSIHKTTIEMLLRKIKSFSIISNLKIQNSPISTTAIRWGLAKVELDHDIQEKLEKEEIKVKTFRAC